MILEVAGIALLVLGLVLATVGLYGLLFAAGWLVVYVYVYLSRGPVTP